ncbi:MAG: hypothetical protein FP825_01080 [Hyphomonas sp.]|uniref:hypothetical protein n=1 Tax=Hyphomonas sp. TaxID=87 RepID=UPI0017AA6BD1|nr:hypothetical protein [Hyphomonas sp.]MBU3921138.1 hypothetical protein [Alphaproteobacteria bacterium]MBA3067056.1 hypothetical protein [Hyphomonas sp.]MBU4063149.1 hypothetical protein [Alphaproteobacteria bacterium]MBU4164466.1 hypothetical protein [Alphaproteobacteria bacterium]MBU4567433.1 hypothetical protein [Alphaproteobacteria bacterium]
MIPLRALRAHPHYADLFQLVPRLLWPILWWQLNRMIRWMQAEQVIDVLFSTSPWGLITIRYAGYKPDPDLYRPAPRIFRPLNDASWASAVPVEIELRTLSAATRTALFLPREAGGGGIARSAMTEGALTSPLNTS